MLVVHAGTTVHSAQWCAARRGRPIDLDNPIGHGAAAPGTGRCAMLMNQTEWLSTTTPPATHTRVSHEHTLLLL